MTYGEDTFIRRASSDCDTFSSIIRSMMQSMKFDEGEFAFEVISLRRDGIIAPYHAGHQHWI